MNKKTKGLVAGVAGGALLLGAGGTFALWSDSAVIGGGHIQAGALEIMETQGLKWFDVSPDRLDRGQEMDLAPLLGINDWHDLTLNETNWNGASTRFQQFKSVRGGDLSARHVASIDSWEIVPGDFILGQSEVHVDVRGDNLVAELRLESRDALGHLHSFSPELIDAFGMQFVLLERNPSYPGPGQDEWTQLGDALPLDVVTTLELPQSKDLRVLIMGNMSRDLGEVNPGRTNELSGFQESLQNLAITLTQVRPGTPN